jgi:hypothetical protein
MVHSALRLASTLGDIPKATRLESLEGEIEGRIKGMQLNKNFLENRLDEQYRAIWEQRAELDRMEEDAIATMLKEDRENRTLIGSLIESSVKTIFGTEPVDSAGSPHTGNDEDGEVEVVDAGDEIFVVVEAER